MNDTADAGCGVSSVPQDRSTQLILKEDIKYSLSLFGLLGLLDAFSLPWKIRNLCFKNNIVKRF